MKFRFTRKNIFRLIFITPVIVLGILSAGAGIEFYNWKSRNAEWYEIQGDKFYAEGEYGKSISYYLKSEALDDGRISIHRKLGKLYLEKGILSMTDDFSGARLEYEKANEIDKNDQESAMGYAQTLYLLGEKKQSLSVLSSVSGDLGFDFLLLEGKIKLLNANYALNREGDDFDSAVLSFERASQLRKTPELQLYLAAAFAPLNLAFTTDEVERLMDNLESDQNSEYFRSALNIRNAISGSGKTLSPVLKNYQLGKAFAEEGFPTVALYFLNLANQNDSTYAPAYLAKGRVALEIGDFLLAKSSFETVVYFLQPYNSEAIYLLAKAESLGSRPEDALEVFESAIAKHYYSEDLFYDYGKLLYDLGRKSDAKKQLEQALLTNPAHIDARELLINILIQGKDFDEALQVAEDSGEIFTEDDFPVSQFLRLLVLSEEGSSLEGSLQIADRLLEIPDNDFVQKNLAKIYFAKAELHKNLEQDDLAIEYYFKALDADFVGEISPKAKDELSKYKIFDKKRDFWWWIDEIV